ncbi:MAG: hypothetical protein ABI263_04030 [Gelidibacter sp.]
MTTPLLQDSLNPQSIEKSHPTKGYQTHGFFNVISWHFTSY